MISSDIIQNHLRDLLNENKGTEHESYLAEMRNRYAFLSRRLQGMVPDGNVLDVGASPGLFTELLRRMGYNAVGIDKRPDQRFPAAVGRGESNLFYKYGIPVIKSDVVNSPFPVQPSSFDAVMMNETIEHLKGSPLPCLEQIRMALKPSGFLFLTTPNIASLSNRVRLLSGRNIYTPIKVVVNVPAYKLHNREYTMGDLVELLEMAGFRILDKRWLNLGGARRSAAGELARKGYYFATALMPSCRSNLFVCAAPENSLKTTL